MAMKSNNLSAAGLLVVILLFLFWSMPVFAAGNNLKSLKQNDIKNPKNWTEPTTGMVFVLVPGGCFQMGCGNWTSECNNDEVPVHKVCLDEFWLGKYEVTQEQWHKIMAENPAHFKLGDNYPVETITWERTQEFLAVFSRQTNLSFRLPAEAEWEYAARSGGLDEKYSGGNKIENFSWCSFNSGQTTQPVGTKKPNGLGLYDMSGNVSEWVQDLYQKNYYNNSPQKNPKGPPSGPGHVYRGGCWGDIPGFLRVVGRNWIFPNTGLNTIGLRIILAEPPEL